MGGKETYISSVNISSDPGILFGRKRKKENGEGADARQGSVKTRKKKGRDGRRSS